MRVMRSPYCFCNRSESSGSISTAINSFGSAASFSVSTPSPGPISTTTSSGDGSTASTMRATAPRLRRKCWPHFFFGWLIGLSADDADDTDVRTINSSAMDQATINTDIASAHEVIARLRAEVGRAVIGQEAIVDRLVIALLIRGHVLLEGVPGLAKTLLVKTLAGAIDASFHRIQFTPDLLPADITGTLIFNPADRVFTPRQGPIFANLVLADEINRAPAKVQSALLEAMQEKQVTIGDQTFKLEEPFLVLATQNPIEQEGTYPLPEAQVDRFMLKLKIGYPSREEERQILDLMARTNSPPSTTAVVEPKQILLARQVINEIYIDDKVKDYIVDLVCATRSPEAYKIQV